MNTRWSLPAAATMLVLAHGAAIASPIFGVQMQVAAYANAGPQDYHNSGGLSSPFSLNAAESALSMSVVQLDQTYRLTASAFATGDARLGTLRGVASASASQSPWPGPNFGPTAAASVSESWTETFTAMGQASDAFPQGAGNITYQVTFAPSAMLAATTGGADCQNNLAVAYITALLIGPVVFQQSLNDCSGPPFHAQAAQFVVPAGSEFTFTGAVTASVNYLGFYGAYGPDGAAAGDVLFDHHFFLDPVTPGGSYSTASGQTYLTLQVPEPASFALVFLAMAIAGLRVRFRL